MYISQPVTPLIKQSINQGEYVSNFYFLNGNMSTCKANHIIIYNLYIMSMDIVSMLHALHRYFRPPYDRLTLGNSWVTSRLLSSYRLTFVARSGM